MKCFQWDMYKTISGNEYKRNSLNIQLTDLWEGNDYTVILPLDTETLVHVSTLEPTHSLAEMRPPLPSSRSSGLAGLVLTSLSSPGQNVPPSVDKTQNKSQHYNV